MLHSHVISSEVNTFSAVRLGRVELKMDLNWALMILKVLSHFDSPIRWQLFNVLFGVNANESESLYHAFFRCWFVVLVKLEHDVSIKTQVVVRIQSVLHFEEL